ncbi:MAG: hypothetical protein KGQ49_03910, partial [Verrucomicrobia bacterium]|nr:hypothetical protein [Verrucomicrobiota bacterium]
MNSSAGYVLYGDAPMSIDTCEAPSIRFFSSPKPETIFLMKGKELWADLQLPVDDKEYILTTHQDKGKCHFICINRKAFLHTVQENLSLFQYALGPTVTPESFLQSISSSPHWFSKLMD